MIKGILFDLGGVLINLTREESLEAFHTQMGCYIIDSLMNCSRQEGIYGAMEEGKVTADEFRAEILRHSRPGCVPEDVDRCLRIFTASIDKPKVDLLKNLAGKYELYMLSNNNPISMEMIYSVLEKAGVDVGVVFKDEFISYRMKLLKPDHEIYHEAVRLTGRRAEELLFVDDNMANVVAARECGLHAAYYQIGTDLEACLETALKECL